MKRQLIAEKWNEFSSVYLRGQATRNQYIEMRRAFYTGAQSVMFGVIAALAPESEPTKADLQIMQDLSNELSKFAEDLKKGLV